MAVLALSDAKVHLNITGSSEDAELQTLIAACEARIAAEVGPLEPTVVTDRVTGGGLWLRLPKSPAVSLTSITPVGGTALTLSDLYLDKKAAIVTFLYNQSFWAWQYDVVYTAGRTTCPDNLLMAVKELLRYVYSASQRGGTRRPGPSQSDGYSNTLPGVGDDLPFDVQKWLPGERKLGFA